MVKRKLISEQNVDNAQQSYEQLALALTKRQSELNDHKNRLQQLKARLAKSEALKDKAVSKDELHEVNLIGGGIQFYVDGLKKHFETKNMKLNVPKNTRYKNVEGVLKSLLFKNRHEKKSKNKTS